MFHKNITFGHDVSVILLSSFTALKHSPYGIYSIIDCSFNDPLKKYSTDVEIYMELVILTLIRNLAINNEIELSDQFTDKCLTADTRDSPFSFPF